MKQIEKSKREFPPFMYSNRPNLTGKEDGIEFFEQQARRRVL